MEVKYRKKFLKDLKKLKNQEIYHKIYDIVFELMPKVEDIREIMGIRPMKGCVNRYRIRIGDYRIGIEVESKEVEVMRVLHRKEFYRYFP
jgi:mRNA-degrading endonuclease RelE of RelBE toxin-antitoxin system